MTASEGDVIFSRASVALAKSQRLIASWLPPPTHSELAAAKTEEHIENEERKMFAPVPELLGVGATLPKDGDVKREESSSNDRLRKQLLGRDYKKVQVGKMDKGKSGGIATLGSKSRPIGSKRDIDQESEDEGGRSSLGKSKRKQQTEQEEGTADTSGEGAHKATKASMRALSPRKGAINYLDQVLAEKSQRRHKKTKKRKRKHDSKS